MDEREREALEQRVEAVVRDLAGVERRPVQGGAELVADGRPFSMLGPGRIEVLLEPSIAAAAVRTPDTVPSGRGPGWVTFTPATHDRFALDRAEAWLRSAHRRALEG
jgi:hypothetical protein